MADSRLLSHSNIGTWECALTHIQQMPEQPRVTALAWIRHRILAGGPLYTALSPTCTSALGTRMHTCQSHALYNRAPRPAKRCLVAARRRSPRSALNARQHSHDARRNHNPLCRRTRNRRGGGTRRLEVSHLRRPQRRRNATAQKSALRVDPPRTVTSSASSRSVPATTP